MSAKLTIPLFIVMMLILSFSSLSLQVTEIQGQINNASSQLNDFFYNTPKEDFIIITGSKISIEEKVIFNMLKANVPEVQGVQVESDTYASESKDIDNRTLILLGSDRTNYVSKMLLDENRLAARNASEVEPFVLDYTQMPNGKKVLILFSQKELLNNGNQAGGKSPLSGFIDKKYVPAAASLISLLLLYLWSLISKSVMSLFSDFTSSKVIQRVTRGKKIKKKDINTLKLHEYIDVSELLALAFTTLIFAITMSWSYSSNISEFKRMLLINLIIVGTISFIREAVRQTMCYRHKIKTEYIFWPIGSFITLISTFLGNTFSLTSYTLVEDKADEKKLGKISFFISFFTFVAAAIAYVLNTLAPSLVLQMIFVYSLMVLFIELFPLAPFAGNDIKKWRMPVYLVFYFVVGASYLMLNFTTYI